MERIQCLICVFALVACARAQNAPLPNRAVRITHGPVVEKVSNSTATIAWSTDSSAGTTVRYGTQRDGLTLIKQAPWGGYTHRVELSGLQPGTKYYYQAESGQAQGSGETATSDVGEFTTRAHDGKAVGETPLKLAISTGPKVEHTTETSATISWTTNVPSSTVVRYGLSETKLARQQEHPWGGVTHRVELRELKPDTLYYYRVESEQGQGAEGKATSTVQSFRTNISKQ